METTVNLSSKNNVMKGYGKECVTNICTLYCNGIFIKDFVFLNQKWSCEKIAKSSLHLHDIQLAIQNLFENTFFGQKSQSRLGWLVFLNSSWLYLL